MFSLDFEVNPPAADFGLSVTVSPVEVVYSEVREYNDSMGLGPDKNDIHKCWWYCIPSQHKTPGRPLFPSAFALIKYILLTIFFNIANKEQTWVRLQKDESGREWCDQTWLSSPILLRANGTTSDGDHIMVTRSPLPVSTPSRRC